MEKILIVDDEEDLLKMMSRILEYEDYQVLTAKDAASVRRIFEREDIAVVLTDVKLPDGNGIKLVSELKALQPDVEIICLTAYGNIPDGVKAIQNGAFDYLVKGDDNNKIIPLVAKAMEKHILQRKVTALTKRVQKKTGFGNIIGSSRAILAALEMAQKVAPLDTTVLLTGETGTGKEVFAQGIHSHSKRMSENFLAINCSALGKDLLESELFGHKAGAFTGASKDKKGLLEEAHKGTVFLDEIGEMNLDLQAKILRFLEEGTFIKLGDSKETRVDVRVIAATNRNLEKEVESGTFREDLFYRLSVFTITLPSLIDRLEDIPELAEHFVKHFSAKCAKKEPALSESFLSALRQHRWKGNIRELRNVIERSVILCDGAALPASVLPSEFYRNNSGAGDHVDHTSLKEVEKQHIAKILAHTNNNKTKAAELLDIGISTLYNKIKEYNL